MRTTGAKSPYCPPLPIAFISAALRGEEGQWIHRARFASRAKLLAEPRNRVAIGEVIPAELDRLGVASG